MHLPGYMQGYMQSTCPDCQSQISDRDSACIICGYQKQDRGAAEQKVTLLAMQLKKKWGYLNAQGELVVPPRFDKVRGFAAGLAAVQENGKWGYINTEGEMVIPPRFDEAGSFAANGLAMALENIKGGEIREMIVPHADTEGELVVPPEVDDDFAIYGLDFAAKFQTMAMMESEKWGYINMQGEWVIPPKFDFVCEFAPNGLACAGEKMPMNPHIAQFYDTRYRSDLDSVRERVRMHACTWGYINTQGEWVIPPKFSGVDSFAANGLARAMDGEKWGYINTEGEWAIPPKFDAAWDFIPNGLACAGEKREGGKYAIKWGYINPEGEWVIPPRFGNACPFFAANGLACVTSNENGKNGYINRQGEWVIPPRFEVTCNFEPSGLAWVEENGTWGYINSQGERVTSPSSRPASSGDADGLGLKYVWKSGKRNGYINTQGEWVIPPRFGFTHDFAANGLALVRENGGELVNGVYVRDEGEPPKWGYIDERGEWVIPPRFESANNFDANGLAVVWENEKHGCINAQGEWVIPPIFEDNFHFQRNGLARVREKDKWGYINTRGEWVVPPRFDKVKYFAFSADGLARVKENGKWGCVNAQGELVVPTRFDKLKDFAATGLARARENGKWGYINLQGEWVVPPKFGEVEDFTADGLAIVSLKKRGTYGHAVFGYINTEGEWVIPPRFANARSFDRNGLAVVGVNFRLGYINLQGEWVIRPRFHHAWDFGNRDWTWAHEDDGWGSINKKGEWIIPPKFGGVGDYAYGLIPAQEKGVFGSGKWGYINLQGEWVIEPMFDFAFSFEANGLAMIREYEDDDGYINTKGEVVIPVSWCPHPMYSEINGLMTVRDQDSGNWGYMNLQGKWVIPPMFDRVEPFAANGLARVEAVDIEQYVDSDGNIVAYVDMLYGLEVLKNARGEIIWPQKTEAQIIEEQKARWNTVVLQKYRRRK